MRLKVWLLVAATLLTSVILSQTAFAARVTQVKGNKVLIDLEGESLNVGDKYFVMIGGKKKAVVTINKTSKAKAIATVDKGKPAVNGTLAFAKAGNGGGGGATASADRSVSKHLGKKGKSWGLLGGYSMDSQTAKLTDITHTQFESTKMSGSGFSVLGFYDLPYSGPLSVTARGGIEMFSVTGTSANSYCNGQVANCSTKITYLTLDALLRLNFMSGGTFTPWGGLGLGIYYPLSKTTNALSPDIGMSTVGLLNLGFNYALSSTSYIQAYGEYGYFPSSPDVKTTIMGLKAGYGMMF